MHFFVRFFAAHVRSDDRARTWAPKMDTRSREQRSRIMKAVRIANTCSERLGKLDLPDEELRSYANEEGRDIG
jgi:hypothetical protein